MSDEVIYKPRNPMIDWPLFYLQYKDELAKRGIGKPAASTEVALGLMVHHFNEAINRLMKAMQENKTTKTTGPGVRDVYCYCGTRHDVDDKCPVCGR